MGNAGLGNNVLNNLTTGGLNTAIGSLALQADTTGFGNTAVGRSSLTNLLTGSENIAVGGSSGINYIGAESNNIVIGNGGVAAETNTIHIGTTGSGAGEQDTTFIAGINGATVASPAYVVIDTVTEQLGITAISFYDYVEVNTSPYVVTGLDSYIAVDTSTIAITLQFPNTALVGRTFTVKDFTGDASVHNITVTTVGGVVLIDGATTFTINNDYQSIQLLFDGTGYQIF